jgi:hypothetical protein
MRRSALAFALVNFVLSAAALTWLVWLSPPTHWFDAKKGEPAVAVPVSRLTPKVPLRQIQRDIDYLETRVSDVDVSDLELQLEELSVSVDDLETTVSEICNQLGFASGTLYDIYFAAC